MNARQTSPVAATGRGSSRAFGAASRGASPALVARASAGVSFALAARASRVTALLALTAMLATAQVAFSAEPADANKGAARNVGQLTYDKWCAPCHAPGPDHPGTQALDALYRGGKPGALIQRTDLTPPIVKQFVRKGVSVMPFFRKTEISDAELDALAAFLSKRK
ncbi:MAG: cytochrome c [Gammaproteobacteria bacterium]